MSTSFNAGSSSRPLIVVRILANRAGLVSPRNAASNTLSALKRFAAHKCPVDRRSSKHTFVKYNFAKSFGVAGSVLMPKIGTSVERTSCAAMSVVPSPPNAMTKSHPSTDSALSAERSTHLYFNPRSSNMRLIALTEDLCVSWRSLTRA